MDDELDDFFAWREANRRKHRTMTAGEYVAWCRSGDILSTPAEGNAFPGGLTILIGRERGILGKIGE